MPLLLDLRFIVEILVNWEKSYINDIKTVDVNSNCPSGYTFWHNTKWPGISEGCNCIGINSYANPHLFR